jgi:virginiamycin A acetyltransferase
MNGANHQMNAVSTFPFYILEGWNEEIPSLSEMPVKGDTIVGNDVWIGDGVIIGLNSVAGSDIPPYTIAAGNPARLLKKRFDDELIALLEKFKWWNLSVKEINELIPLLTSSDLEKVRKEIRKRVNG